MKREKLCAICDKPLFSSLAAVCSTQCSKEWAKDPANVKKQRAKLEKIQEQEDRAALREFRAKDVPYQHKLTQKVFNRMRVLQEFEWFADRGAPPQCISCGRIDMDWCCGHFKTTGAQGILRYDPMNTYLQCNRYCNMGLSGNLNGTKTTRGYIQGLKERFGYNEAWLIMDYCNAQTAPRKYTGYELQDMRAKFAKAIRVIESATYSTDPLDYEGR